MTLGTATTRSLTYPIMLDLANSDVLVVGGGAVGERRVAGLVEAGARVTLVAPDAAAALAELASEGRISWSRRTFRDEDVRGMAVVFSATGIAEVDGAVVSASRSAGVLANAADGVAHCDFHVPAVARRGDITIAVGTGGAAPALAARLRDRFAASLGPEWERLAELLGRMRDLARGRIPDPSLRMRVLALASRDDNLLAALARGAAPDAEGALEAARIGLAHDQGAPGDLFESPAPIEARRARVSLVGTGPGAPDLLTLRAVNLIREADVIVFDDLVDRRVLAEAPPHAELVYFGKRGWRKGPVRPGAELLAERALEGGGRHVVRLKGGDPNVFGRSAEEIAALEAAQVPFEIVPGVTAALAASAAARIPLTARGVSASVTLVTGVAASGAEGNADPATPATIARLVSAGGTVAVYMGLRSLPEITQGLIREGIRVDLPVTVVGAASLPEETVVRGSLADIAALAADTVSASPALVILGEVAR